MTNELNVCIIVLNMYRKSTTMQQGSTKITGWLRTGNIRLAGQLFTDGITRRVLFLAKQSQYLAGFFMRVTCRGFAGRQVKVKDISNCIAENGSNCLATTPQPAGYPDGINLLEATLKKVRLCVNSVSCIQKKLRSLKSSVRLVHRFGLYPAIKVKS